MRLLNKAAHHRRALVHGSRTDDHTSYAELSRQVLRLEAETLARADILEKAKLLAAIRMEQEGLEKELNTVLKNRVLSIFPSVCS